MNLKAEIDFTETYAKDALTNLASVNLESDVDELFYTASEAMDSVTISLNTISETTSILGDQMTKRTKQAQSILKLPTTEQNQQVKNLANNSASDLERFVKGYATAIPNFKLQYEIVMEKYEKILLTPQNRNELSDEEYQTTLKGLSELHHNMEFAIDHLEQFYDTISSLPRMNPNFNRAKKKAAAVLKDLLILLQTSNTQISALL